MLKCLTLLTKYENRIKFIIFYDRNFSVFASTIVSVYCYRFRFSFQKHHKHRHQQQRLGCCLHIICEWEVALNLFVIECNPSSPLMVVNCPATLTLLRNGTICRLLSVSKKLSVQPIQRLDVGLILLYW